ncbi:MAG TPA: thioesterase family protein [Prolixibacteraceae bacterium]|nr:acyl-CoA thioesterase [Bacteroidales bacterium]HPB05428.1 thioesterase family protein [Prolixibacteraceae bacterium]HQN93564.1 thioesterase family protein [Prolixibacteraceae bacterium]HUM88108.1 thioesterase family protein [Prolixibacteraceae bacterium]
MATFKNKFPVQVRFSDVDVMGHVSNTVYQNYFDAGKLNYFEEVLPEMDFVTIGIVGASIKIDYLKPIFMKTRILVETRVAQIGTKSITMEHCIIDEHSGELLSTCHAVMVCFDLKERLSIPIPEEWKKKIATYDENVVIK